MSEQEQLREDTPVEPDDEKWQMGDPPEEGTVRSDESEPSPHQGEEAKESEA